MLSSRLLLNLGLVILLALLASLALFNSNEEKSESPFSLLKKNDITSIQINHKETNTQILKSGNIWNITKPVAAEADEFRIHAILAILTSADNNFYDIEKSDYSKFSLSPPFATLTLNKQTFLFGSTSSVNNKRYVLTNNKLFLLDDTFYPLIASGYKNIMRRQLFASNTKLREIKFNKIKVFQNEKSGWQSENQNISSDDLKRFVDNWLFIQAYAITSAQQPYTGTEVIFKTVDNNIFKFLIQKDDMNTTIINPVSGLSYQFDITAFESLTQPTHFSSDDK